MLAAPREVLHGLGIDAADRTVEVSTRLLGLRDLLQGGVSLAVPDVGPLRVGRWVDLVHLATMLVVAGRSSRLRRPALFSAVAAGAWAAVEHHAAAST